MEQNPLLGKYPKSTESLKKQNKRPLRTRFPRNRIKRIMQEDEDVGTINRATPVLMSKAIELFVRELVDQTTGVTMSQNLKTMTPSHLKEAVEETETFDFLRELLEE